MDEPAVFMIRRIQATVSPVAVFLPNPTDGPPGPEAGIAMIPHIDKGVMNAALLLLIPLHTALYK